jgi:hypothetical protein
MNHGISEDISDIEIEINGESIYLYEYAWGLGGDFNFENGEAYLFRLTYIHNGQLIEGTFNFLFPLSMIVDWPNYIYPEPTDLTWILPPNDSLNNNFTEFTCWRLGGVIYRELLSPSIRELSIRDEIILYQSDQISGFSFYVTNYSVSGRVSIWSDKYHGASYRNGVLVSTGSW